MMLTPSLIRVRKKHATALRMIVTTRWMKGGQSTYYRDTDEDGDGNVNDTPQACEPPTGTM